jgi:hypothetical protein
VFAKPPIYFKSIYFVINPAGRRWILFFTDLEISDYSIFDDIALFQFLKFLLTYFAHGNSQNCPKHAIQKKA